MNSGTERDRVVVCVKTFESMTHSRSYFASRYGRIKLLILGFTPTIS